MWKFIEGDEPIVATAIHSGHNIRKELIAKYFVSEEVRFREEDPFTELFIENFKNQIIVQQSRFEFDLNRNRKNAIYMKPKDAWGLKVWQNKPNLSTLQKSLKYYDLFYDELKNYCTNLEDKFGKFVIFDIHSYNHRRGGEEAPPDNPKKNPEIIIGTSNMEISNWENIVSVVETTFKNGDYFGKHLDVRRNIKYSGGNFARWIHQNFPNSACVISIEFKKIFMDEWSGKLDETAFNQLRKILKMAKQAVLEIVNLNFANNLDKIK